MSRPWDHHAPKLDSHAVLFSHTQGTRPVRACTRSSEVPSYHWHVALFSPADQGFRVEPPAINILTASMCNTVLIKVDRMSKFWFTSVQMETKYADMAQSPPIGKQF